MLPVRLCDSTLTLVVPSGTLMVADKHNWSRDSVHFAIVLLYYLSVVSDCHDVEEEK